jgi:hypothetical protein
MPNGRKVLRNPISPHPDFRKIHNESSRVDSGTLSGRSLRGTMKQKEKSSRNPIQKKPLDVLEEFIGVFVNKGWLNQTIRIRRHERRYRISCSETGFIAYRINDHSGVSPGIPGWPVCFVTQKQIMDDSDMSGLASTEPRVHDWLRFIMEDDLELI